LPRGREGLRANRNYAPIEVEQEFSSRNRVIEQMPENATINSRRKTMTTEYEHPSSPNPDTNETHRTPDTVSMAADDSTHEETNVMKKSHHYDTQPEAPADDWPEPPSFADAGSDDLPGFHEGVLPLSFMPVVSHLSLAFNVSFETITVILTFMVSAAFGRSVRVQDMTGEWVDVGHRVALISDSDEKVSKVLLSMANAFLEARFQQASAHVAGESDGDKARMWFEAVSHEVRNPGNMTAQSMQEIFRGMAAQANAPSDSPLSGSKSTACPDFAFPPTLDGLCVGLQSGEPDRDIVIGDADYLINLNGTLSPGVVEERSSFPTDYVYLMSPANIAFGFLCESTRCLREDPFALVEPEDTVKADDAQIQIGAKGLTHLREVVTHAFRIQARGINEPIKFALSAEAQAMRESYREFADHMSLNEGHKADIEQVRRDIRVVR